MRVLVTGATGYVGGRLVSRLLDSGHELRVLVRDARRVQSRSWRPRVKIFEGGLEDNQVLSRALDGVDAAYYLVHSMTGSGDFVRRDRELAQGFVQAAAAVPHVVYLGGLVPDGGSVSRHLASRREVGEILRDGLSVTEFRAGPVIGSGSASFEMVRYLTERLPAMIAPRWISNRVRPIATRDVLEYLLAALDRGPSGVVDIGTDPLTFKEMMQGFAEIRGLRRVIVPVPVLAPRLAALWVGLVTPIPNSLAVPLVEGIVHPVVGDTSRARSLFPEILPTSYARAVARALEATRANAVATRWSGAGGIARETGVDLSEGVFREVRTARSKARPEEVHRAATSLGGSRGWLVWDWAWWLRGLVDRLVGGPGLRRGRRHPRELEVGESVDFWRVEAIEAGRLLRLRAEMRLPGEAWLQWETEEDSQGRTQLVQTAIFLPVGLWGTLYWWALYPAHAFMFQRLAQAIVRLAERESET